MSYRSRNYCETDLSTLVGDAIRVVSVVSLVMRLYYGMVWYGSVLLTVSGPRRFA